MYVMYVFVLLLYTTQVMSRYLSDRTRCYVYLPTVYHVDILIYGELCIPFCVQYLLTSWRRKIPDVRRLDSPPNKTKKTPLDRFIYPFTSGIYTTCLPTHPGFIGIVSSMIAIAIIVGLGGW